MTAIVDAPVIVLRGHGEDPARVGGKGWWLDRLIAEGFPVPVAAALTTDAYRAVVALEPLASLIEELRTSPPGEDLEREQHRVNDAFTEAALPDEVNRAIASALDAVHHTPDGKVAARSSATAEDLQGMSFAGQYASVLNLRSPADVERAVRIVWASLWYPGPRAYRRHLGVEEDDLAMAVILMRMVPADSAGVAFTVDPAGDRGSVRVETVEGLGEQLVSGKVTPAVHLVPRALDRSPAGAAPPPEHELVAALAMRVEQAFGGPQDVEWARHADDLWLLQARPITASHRTGPNDPDDREAGAAERWSSAGIAEMLPGVLAPLVWDTAGRGQDRAFRRLFADLGAHVAGPDPDASFVGRVHGRAALSLDTLGSVATELGVPAADVERQYIGVSDEPRKTEGPEDGRRAADGRAPAQAVARLLTGLRRDFRMTRLRQRATVEAETCIVATADVVAARRALHGLTDDALVAYRHRLVDLLDRLFAAETATAASAMTAYDSLLTRLTKHLDDAAQAERWAQRLTASDGSDSWLTDLGRTVAGLVGPIESLDHIVAASTLAAASRRLARSPAGREALVALDRALQDAGSMSVPAGPTWAEDRERAWPALRTAIAEHHNGRRSSEPAPASSAHGRASVLAGDWRELTEQLRHQRGWTRTRILTGQIVDVRLVALHRLAQDAVGLLDRRERAKQAVLRLGGEVRRVHLEIGRRLTARRSLNRAEAVDLLTADELPAALTGDAPTASEMARRRRCLEEDERRGPLRTDGTDRAGDTATPPADGAVLHGRNAASGRRRGRAHVCHRPGDLHFTEGDVLVAHSTDASWSPLFLRAAAIVVEEGGPLSHAAILARELGIPAVVNVPGIVARLDQWPADVIVDGDRGTVTILDPDPEETEDGP